MVGFPTAWSSCHLPTVLGELWMTCTASQQAPTHLRRWRWMDSVTLASKAIPRKSNAWRTPSSRLLGLEMEQVHRSSTVHLSERGAGQVCQCIQKMASYIESMKEGDTRSQISSLVQYRFFFLFKSSVLNQPQLSSHNHAFTLVLKS